MGIWFKRLLFVSLLAFALVAIFFLTMPAQFVVTQFSLPDSVRMENVTGTMQSGRATGIEYRGQVGQLAAQDLRLDVAWMWCPSRGLAAACVRLDSPLLEGTGTIAYSLLGGHFTATDARLNARVQGYPLQLSALKTQLQGIGDIRVETLSLDPDDAQLLTDLRADGEVKRLGTEQFVLGNYVWRVQLEEGSQLVSDFSGGSDRFSIKGQATLNLSEQSYRYAAEMKTEDAGLQRILKSAAKQSSGGTLTFSGDGRLNF